MTIRLLNAAETLMPPDGKNISHDDPLPWKDGTFAGGTISVPVPDGMRFTTAHFDTIDGLKKKLDFVESKGMINITLEAGLLQDFGMILIR